MLATAMSPPPEVGWRLRTSPPKHLEETFSHSVNETVPSRRHAAHCARSRGTPQFFSCTALFSLCQRNRVATPPRSAWRAPYARSRGRSQQRPRFQMIRCELDGRLLREFVLNGILHDTLYIELDFSSKNLSSKKIVFSVQSQKTQTCPNALPLSIL